MVQKYNFYFFLPNKMKIIFVWKLFYPTFAYI